MHTLVIAEHDNKQLKSATRHTLKAASSLNLPVIVLIAGYQCEAVANEVAKCEGVSQVLLAEHIDYLHQFPENISKLVISLVDGASYVMAPADTFGKQLMPRVAALLDTEQISDVIRIDAPDTFVRPIYAGNALATVKSTAAKKVLTIRSTAFPMIGEQTQSASISHIDVHFPLDRIQFVDLQVSESSRPELGNARVVVSGGRALQNAENFKMIEALADKLGGAVGASRAAVDAGFVPNDYQVGQTGKIVAPELYIAIGISGAIQHLAGMKDSKVVVAINKDPDAPIFQVADYGLVGDLFALLPELMKELG
ncbi:MAG: electron transfer flavoprotein subunit alpha/FixB family protein [Legionellales bacterium]|nr:electron transfer flavoprotein subunit alpha/FixB family protein [Legionellales bacterium]